MTEETNNRSAQMVKTHRKWWVRLEHWLFFWKDFSKEITTCTIPAKLSGSTFQTVDATELWEQYCFCRDDDWDLERDCKLVSKLPNPDGIMMEHEKTYWVVIEEQDVRKQLNTN